MSEAESKGPGDESRAALIARLKSMMVEHLMLPVGAAELKDDQALFGPDSLGLDSVDALQLVVALEKTFGLKITDQTEAKEILRSIQSMADAIERRPVA